MKRIFSITSVLILFLLTTSGCSNIKKDIQLKDKYDLSEVSFIMKTQDSYINRDFGMYGVIDNESAILLRGNVEKGKIQENSEIAFVDETGKMLYSDKVFKIEIIDVNTGIEQKSHVQHFAESGDNVAIYLKAGDFSDEAQINKSMMNLEKIRKSQFVVSDQILTSKPIMPIIMSLLVLAFMCLLQIFLSLKKNRTLGLILPVISFSYFIFNIFILVNQYLTLPKVGIHNEYDISGHLISTTTIENTGFNYQNIFLSCLITAIPIVIQFTIYFICKAKLKKQAKIHNI